MGRIQALALLLLLWPGIARAQDDSLEALGTTLRPLLAGALPAVLYEKADNWGHQERTPNGLTWHRLRPEVQKTPRNDGRWRKLRITAQDLPRSLELNLSDLQTPDADRQTFKIFLAVQTGVEFEQQNWESGVRLWSGSVRARLRLKLNLECESLVRTEPGTGPLPDLVFRLRVTKADVSYDNLVVEHLPGVGGSTAKVLGEALRSSLKQWKPSIERDLLARANAAVIRAADTREVRLGLGGLTKKKN